MHSGIKKLALKTGARKIKVGISSAASLTSFKTELNKHLFN